MVPQNCHPDRSVAKWRDLLFFPGPHAAILLEGEPERGVRQMAVNGPTKLSSRPERSGVEGPAVLSRLARSNSVGGKARKGCQTNGVNGPTKLSSRPERSGVEGPCCSFPARTQQFCCRES